MSIVSADKKYTIEDYLKLDDGQRYELIEGELILVPRPRTKHQKIANRYFAALDRFVLMNNLGEVNGDVDVYLGDEVGVCNNKTTTQGSLLLQYCLILFS